MVSTPHLPYPLIPEWAASIIWLLQIMLHERGGADSSSDWCFRFLGIDAQKRN